jgi:4-amino-4-deoxy-L-arabinose transferase-like glycosyltransferase
MFLRLYKLGDVPAGFFADEAAIGVNAHLIATTLRDDHHVLLPVLFQSFDDYKSPVSIYPTVPFVLLFGLHEWVVRLVPALFGISDILALYFLVKQLFSQNKNRIYIALLSALFLAISPWHIQLSRVALDSMTAMLLFLIIGIIAFLRIPSNPRYSFLASFSFTLTMYTYSPIRIFLPVFLFALCMTSIPVIRAHKQYFLVSLVLFFILLLPLGLLTLFQNGAARFQQVSIFANPPERESVIHHVFDNYVSHYSFDFLFLKGAAGMSGQTILRHSIVGMGELYLFQLPLCILGLFLLFSRRDLRSFSHIIFFWLLLYPLGSIFTTAQNAQATRSFIGVIPFQIIAAIGGTWFIAFMIKRLRFAATPFLFVLGALLLVSFLHYYQNYFSLYPQYSSGYNGWQYGPKEIARYFADHNQAYDELVFPPAFNQPEIFLSFYFPQGCPKCIVGQPDTTFDPGRKQLFAITPVYLHNYRNLLFKIKSTIYYPNKDVAFYLGEVQKK